MNEIEVFMQGEGLREIQLIRIAPGSRIGDLVEEAYRLGMPPDGEPVRTTVEDAEEEYGPELPLTEAGIGHRSRVHCHRCRQVSVIVNFNDQQFAHSFPPSTTIAKVKRWADKELGLSTIDATEHALQLCSETTRPPEDVHLGTLVTFPACSICFDLVPKVRVEG